MSVYDWPFARYYWEVQRLILWNDYEGLLKLTLARATPAVSEADKGGEA